MTNDPNKRIEELLDMAEPAFAAAFLSMVKLIKDKNSIETLATMLSQGKFAEALSIVEIAAKRLADVWIDTYGMSAKDATRYLIHNEIMVSFDTVNEQAIAAMRMNQLRIIREFTDTQREATHLALMNGIRRGANPIEQARAFRNSIGLTQYQIQVIENYKLALEANDSRALERALRDRRFDSTVRRAIESTRPLSAEEIAVMVERYRQRWLKFRAESIARTEALSAVHEGQFESFRQAIASGEILPSWLTQKWNTAGDQRVRESHADMNGQTQPWGIPFISGAGFALRYPGDPRAPASERIRCRCALGIRILNSALRGPVGVTIHY